MKKINAPLRPYQNNGLSGIAKSIASGNTKVILQMATGSGKTRTFIELADRARLKGNKVIIVIRRRSLIFQTALSYQKFTGHKPGIIMGSAKGFDPENPIQIVSIDTITRRMEKPEYKFLLDFNIVITDECHDSTSPKYQNFLQMFPDAFHFGFTATALPTGSKYLADVGWQDAITVIESFELRDQGFLVKDIVYAPAKIDVTGIKTRAGDYDNKSLAQKASESKVVGDIVETWKKYGENRPTMLFAVNNEHARVCAEAFRQAGIGAIAQDQSHNNEERDISIKKLIDGDIKILCNTNIFSTGTDIPKASCLIMARPTKSEILFVQQIGRGLRPYKKCMRCGSDCGAEENCFRCGCDQFIDIKDDCIILDHANNCERFGMAFDPREPKLLRPTEKKKKADLVEDMPKTKTCAACFAVYAMNETNCPYCDHVNEVKERMIKHEEGELRRITANTLNISRFKKTLDKFKAKELRYNLKPAFKFFKLYEEHGDMIFDYSKELELPSWLKGVINKQRVEQLKKEALESTKKSSNFVYSK